MEKIGIEIRQDENTVNDNAKKLELVSNTNFVTNEEIIQTLNVEDVVKTKMMDVAEKIFIQNEKELDESNKYSKVMKVTKKR